MGQIPRISKKLNMKDFSDYVIFGTANGLFAEGVGRLSNARHNKHVFELRRLVSEKKGSRLLFLRRVCSDEGNYFLLGCLIPARDVHRRGGFLGVGILLEVDKADQETLVNAQLSVLRLSKQCEQKFITEGNGGFSPEFDPLSIFSSRSENGIASLITDTESVQFTSYITGQYKIDDKEVARAIYIYGVLPAEDTFLLLSDTPSGAEDQSLSRHQMDYDKERIEFGRLKKRICVLEEVNQNLTKRIDYLENRLTAQNNTNRQIKDTHEKTSLGNADFGISNTTHDRDYSPPNHSHIVHPPIYKEKRSMFSFINEENSLSKGITIVFFSTIFFLALILVSLFISNLVFQDDPLSGGGKIDFQPAKSTISCRDLRSSIRNLNGNGNNEMRTLISCLLGTGDITNICSDPDYIRSINNIKNLLPNIKQKELSSIVIKTAEECNIYTHEGI